MPWCGMNMLDCLSCDCIAHWFTTNARRLATGQQTRSKSPPARQPQIGGRWQQKARREERASRLALGAGVMHGRYWMRVRQ